MVMDVLRPKRFVLFGRRRSTGDVVGDGKLSAKAKPARRPSFHKATAYLKKRTGETAETAPSFDSLSYGDGSSSSIGAAEEAHEGDCGSNSSYLADLASYCDSSKDGVDEQDGSCDGSVAEEDEPSVRTVDAPSVDDSAYHSGSDAVLVWAGEQEDVSVLGESVMMLLNDGPPLEEVVIRGRKDGVVDHVGCSDRTAEESSSVVSEVTSKRSFWTTSDSTVRAAASSGSNLADAGARLTSSRAKLAGSLTPDSLAPDHTDDSRGLVNELQENAKCLLSECDAMLRQLAALDLKRNARLIVAVERCKELTLVECHDLLRRAGMARVAIEISKSRKKEETGDGLA